MYTGHTSGPAEAKAVCTISDLDCHDSFQRLCYCRGLHANSRHDDHRVAGHARATGAKSKRPRTVSFADDLEEEDDGVLPTSMSEATARRHDPEKMLFRRNVVQHRMSGRATAWCTVRGTQLA